MPPLVHSLIRGGELAGGGRVVSQSDEGISQAYDGPEEGLQEQLGQIEKDKMNDNYLIDEDWVQTVFSI